LTSLLFVGDTWSDLYVLFPAVWRPQGIGTRLTFEAWRSTWPVFGTWRSMWSVNRTW
jgi:hypothetical protein